MKQVARRTLALSLALCAALLLTGAPVPSAAQGPESTPTPSAIPETPPSQDAAELVALAERTIERAETAVNTVDLMLGFLQGAGLVITVLLGLATAAGVRTIFEYRKELTDARSELAALRKSFQDDVDESIGKLTATESQVSQSLGEIRERGDRAIRALALLQLGEQQMEARNTQAALRVFEEAFLQDPDNRATNYFLGELYAQEGDLERAIEHIQRAQAGDFRYAPAMAAEAYILRLQGERETTGDARSRLYAQAEARFLDALATDPRALDINNQSIYGVLGGLYKRQGRLAEAIRVYREAERVTPTSSYPVNNLALLYAMQGDNAQAARYFERTAAMSEQLLQRNAADYWARFDLIAARAWLGQGQEARRQIDIALAYPTARGQIGKLRGSLTAIENTASQPDTMQSVRTYLEEALHRPMEGGADGTG